MDPTRLVLEEWARNLRSEIVDRKRLCLLASIDPLIRIHPIQNAALLQGKQCRMKPLPQLFLTFLGKRRDPLGERLRLENAQRHHLPATRATPRLARNLAPFRLHNLNDATDNVAGEALDGREDLGQVTWPAGTMTDASRRPSPTARVKSTWTVSPQDWPVWSSKAGF